MNEQFLKEKDGKFKKYIVFEAFQKLFLEGRLIETKMYQKYQIELMKELKQNTSKFLHRLWNRYG